MPVVVTHSPPVAFVDAQPFPGTELQAQFPRRKKCNMN